MTHEDHVLTAAFAAGTVPFALKYARGHTVPAMWLALTLGGAAGFSVAYVRTSGKLSCGLMLCTTHRVPLAARLSGLDK